MHIRGRRIGLIDACPAAPGRRSTSGPRADRSAPSRSAPGGGLVKSVALAREGLFFVSIPPGGADTAFASGFVPGSSRAYATASPG